MILTFFVFLKSVLQWIYLFFDLVNFILYIILLWIWHNYTIPKKKSFYTKEVNFFEKNFYYKFSIFRVKNSMCSLDGCFWPLVFAKLSWEKPNAWAFIYLFIFECLGIQFFNSLTSELWGTMPCQWSLTFLPREADNFPRGGNHSKYMPPLTYLGWLQPICYNSRLLFIHVKTKKVLLVVKTLIKNIEQQPN